MDTIKVDCTDCGAVFFREKKRGRPAIRCVPCRDKKMGFMGNTVTQFAMARKTETVDGCVMVENAEPCRDCGLTFMRPKKRGKPPVRCASCKDVFEAARTAAISVSQEEVEDAYSGPAVKLLGDFNDRPMGGQAQCPPPRGCGRIFTSDSACETHKVYGHNGNLKECKDPATLGMIPIERRGLPIWRKPMDPETLARKIGG